MDSLRLARLTRVLVAAVVLTLSLSAVEITAAGLKRNGKIAFTSDRDGNREIYVMNADGSGQLRLTTNPGIDDSPEWSPDGTKIAYISQIPSGGAAIFVMNADGTNKTLVTPIADHLDLHIYSLSWAPDGTEIVFYENVGEGSDYLVIVNIDGNGRRTLFGRRGTIAASPAWSPDGSRILFSCSRCGNSVWNRLYTITPDGLDLQSVPTGTPDNFEEASPAWSPVGDKIVFSVWSWDIYSGRIFIANTDGTGSMSFDGCDPRDGNPCPDWSQAPTWSPNGRTILFSIDPTSGDENLFLKNVDGSGFKQLTNAPGRDTNPSWQPVRTPAPADFDGDGRTDVSVFRLSNGVWHISRSTQGYAALQFGIATDSMVPADYDGDGKTDIGVYRNGEWWWVNSSDSTAHSMQFGNAGDIPVPADYTGDGRDEIAIYRSGQWWMFDLSNSQVSVTGFGMAGDRPVAADYDGDGQVDQAVYRSGEWHLNRSTDGYTVVQFGVSSDKLVVGDYDGDGRADPAVYRDGTWYLLRSSDGAAAFQWGVQDDIPVPGDYGGDGSSDLAIYRNGTWYVRGSDGGIDYYQFGLGSDKPVPTAYVR